MAWTYKSATIQGPGRAHRRILTKIVERVFDTAEENTDENIIIHQILSELRKSDFVMEAKLLKVKDRKFTIYVEDRPKIIRILIEGNESIHENSIRSILKSFVNSDLNLKALEADVARIERLYSKAGLQKPKIATRIKREKMNLATLYIRINEEIVTQTEEAEPKGPTRFRREKTRKSQRASPIAQPIADRQSTDMPARDQLIPDDNSREESVSGFKKLEESTGAELAISVDGHAGSALTAEISAYTATWTGRFTTADHARTIRAVVPKAISEIDHLIRLVEARRFNDPETENALNILRSLHQDLGLLIDAVERGKQKPLLVRIARQNAKLGHQIRVGAKIGVVAPALTIGISHLLSAITRVPIDSTMVSTVFATMVAMPLVERHISALPPLAINP